MSIFEDIFSNYDKKYVETDIIALQQELSEVYNYKALPPMYSNIVREVYKNNLPDNFKTNDNKNVSLYTKEGTLIANGYEDIVIGDYGAFVEIAEKNICKDKLKVKLGEEYRINEERYSKNIKYIWLTVPNGSMIKIYYQQKTVDYADYKVGYYYISPFELIAK